ncbi:MAG: glycerol kinase GlpK [bacterium]|nr:glycerol kinase GlpK [bacterium]
MSNKYILTIDQSTSATKAIIFNNKGRLIYRYNISHKQYYPKPGWVEHNPKEIFNNTIKAIKEAIRESGVGLDDIIAISITNQRETALVWNRKTGEPIYNAIVWQCKRSADICEMLEKEGLGREIKEKSGLNLSPYFSASKVRWILENVESAREKAKKGELFCGTIDSWLVWKLTEGKSHFTDYTNASRTQLLNLKELKWDQKLLEIFEVPESMLPELKASDEVFGYFKIEGLHSKLPLTGVIGDSHAALFGQTCFERGTAKATYGTGSSVMMNVGKEALIPSSGIVGSLGWVLKRDVSYVLEGNINYTGAIIKWLVENLELISNPKESGVIASSVMDNGGVYFVPAFVGLGAPYWDSEARAIITGMTSGTKKAHIVRAAEESIAYQIKDIIELMIEESKIPLKELRVDGGPTRDDFLMQFQADILNVPVVRVKIEELSALGSAFIAGITLDLWDNFTELIALRDIDTVFTPQMPKEEVDRLYKGWKQAVRLSLSRLT